MVLARRLRRVILAATLVLAAPLGASALSTLGFETLLNGESSDPTGTFVFPTADATVTVSDDDAAQHQGVAAFDTTTPCPPGPNCSGPDPDLLVDTGIALILQSNDDPGKTGDFFDTPNDEAGGGKIIFEFSNVVTLLTIDLIDINGNGPADLKLIDVDEDERNYSVPLEWTGDIDRGLPLDVGIGTLDLTTLDPQASPGPGPDPATATEQAGFEADRVVRLEVTFHGSAALDNLTFVPEPSTLLLVTLGLAGLGLGGRPRL